MLKITSSQNPLIKEIKSLKTKKVREEKGMFFIEGLKFVQEALKENFGLESILMSECFASSDKGAELLALLRTKIGKCEQVSCYLIPDRLFNELSDTDTPQGVLGMIQMKQYTLGEVMVGDCMFLILDSLQDPGNMGTIIRTADAAGFTAVLVLKGCVDIYNPKVLRSTMGSIFHIPVIYIEKAEECFQELISCGLNIYAAHLDGTINYFELDLRKNIALVVGNEANGISNEIALLAHKLIRIPMIGRSESLNASIAAGILMYESVRQRIS